MSEQDPIYTLLVEVIYLDKGRKLKKEAFKWELNTFPRHPEVGVMVNRQISFSEMLSGEVMVMKYGRSIAHYDYITSKEI